ncbi:hypothetical protein M758_1G090200 [Ceratodon purpureus]|nr:hypothetical protein M758_1G090200 [Ceratodon purpureus]
MHSMACAGVLGVSNSAFWGAGVGSESQWEPVRRISSGVRIVAQRAGGRGYRGGRGDRNWGQGRSGSGTLSRDYGREREEYGSKEGGREEFGRDGGRGRGGESRGGYRGRGGRGSSSSYRGNGRGGYRGSGYGSTRGRGRGADRYDAMRRAAEKKMHEGAVEVVDEETGEKVIVWGIEDSGDFPEPSAEDLKWKPTTMAVAGDVSEEGWYKAMEASMAGASGAFSVKGVRQGGVYNDEEDDDEEEDDLYDSDYDEDEDELDDEPTASIPEEPQVVKTVRPARLRVFGRDFKQKDILKSEASEEVQSGRQALSSCDGAVAQKFDEVVGLGSVVGVDNSRDINDEAEQSWPPAGHLLTGASKFGSAAAPLSDSDGAERMSDKKASSTYNSVDSPSTEEVIDQQWPPVGTIFSGETNASSSRDMPTEASDVGSSEVDSSGRDVESRTWSPQGIVTEGRYTSEENASTSFQTVESRRGASNLSVSGRSKQTAWKDVERVVREEDWKQGGMNPGIIDIDDEDEDDVEFEGRRMVDRKPRESAPVRSNLLDELRLQTHRKLGTKAEAEDVKKSDAKGESAKSQEAGPNEETSSNVTVVKPRGFRDLKARSNYDPSLAAEFFSTKSFKDVGASDEVIAALTTLQLKKPSAIQAMSFKPILDGQSCIVADQTGSGKTLAYLSPLVQMLRAEEGKGDTKKLNKKPRVLVLVPTSELAVQVLNVCRAFSRGGAPFRSIVLTGGFKWKTQVESLAQGADIVVATPGRFLQHLEKGSLKLDNLKTVVLDEVDILYDDQEFTEVLQTLDQAASQRVQYVHVTATLPLDIHDSLLTRYPDAIPLMGPTLHRTAVGLQEVLVDCSGTEGEEKTPEKAFLSKKAALLQLVDQRPVSKTIVFCNKIETCRDVENALYRHDRGGTKLTVLPYHAALSQEARLESMQQFLESQPSKNLFLVCTDRASRGLDSFDVEHVVLFDFPRDPSEYVRRVGRTARGAGGTGKVFVFALGKQVAMARRIMARNEKGRPIHDIPGSAYET